MKMNPEQITRAQAIREMGRPIAYYPNLAKILGVEETIFFCQLMYWSIEGRCSNPYRWVYKTSDQWFDETGLTYKRQKTARKTLRVLGVVEEHNDPLKHRMDFRINWARYNYLLDRAAEPSNPDIEKGKLGTPQTAEPEQPKRSNRNSPLGPPASTKRVVPYTESTPESTYREEELPNPLRGRSEFLSEEGTGKTADPVKEDARDFAGAKKTPDVDNDPGDAEDLDDESCAVAGIPAPQDPEFPKQRNNNPDWCAGLAMFAPGIAKCLAKVFEPSQDPLHLPQVARKAYKRILGGALTDASAKLLARCYRITRFEGTTTPRWKTKSLDVLLERSNLPDAIHACRVAAVDRIDELKMIWSCASSLEMDLQFYAASRNYLLDGASADCCSSQHNRAFLCIAAVHSKIDHVPIRDYDPEQLRHDISQTRYIDVLLGVIDPKTVLGYTLEEIRAIRSEYWDPVAAEVNELEALLKE